MQHHFESADEALQKVQGTEQTGDIICVIYRRKSARKG